MDVVVPFKGSPEERRGVERRLGELTLGEGDTVTVVDNSPGAADGRIPTPAFARNRGAGRGSADWLVFLDADTRPRQDLLDRYFDPPPGERTGLIGGGVVDEPAPTYAPAIERYAHLRGQMSQEDTFDFGDWGYPKTANVACRREAFEQVGGFREHIRAAEDADLTYRLKQAGWEVERREDASVVHASRKTVRGFLAQQLTWGAGGAWIERAYPGSVRLVSSPGLVRWAVRESIGGLVNAARRRDRDAAIFAVLRPLEALAWQLGRLLPNERPIPDSSPWKRLLR